jgi:hypothetical protein
MTEHVSARSNNLPFCELITLQESSVKEKILQRGINLPDDFNPGPENRVTQLQDTI